MLCVYFAGVTCFSKAVSIFPILMVTHALAGADSSIGEQWRFESRPDFLNSAACYAAESGLEVRCLSKAASAKDLSEDIRRERLLISCANG